MNMHLSPKMSYSRSCSGSMSHSWTIKTALLSHGLLLTQLQLQPQLLDSFCRFASPGDEAELMSGAASILLLLLPYSEALGSGCSSTFAC